MDMRIIIVVATMGLLAGCQTGQVLEDAAQSVVYAADRGAERVLLCVMKRDSIPEEYNC
jgi:hypothetical protein